MELKLEEYVSCYRQWHRLGYRWPITDFVYLMKAIESLKGLDLFECRLRITIEGGGEAPEKYALRHSFRVGLAGRPRERPFDASRGLYRHSAEAVPLRGSLLSC